MTYLVIFTEKAEGDLDRALLEAHINHLKRITETNNLVICGPAADGESAVLIIRAASLNEVTSLVESDPFIQNGYYQKFTICEFIEANCQNNWLA